MWVGGLKSFVPRDLRPHVYRRTLRGCGKGHARFPIDTGLSMGFRIHLAYLAA